MLRLKTILPSLILLFAVCPLRAADYDIDTSHASVGFKIRHLGLSTVSGQFDKFTGSFSLDPADLKTLKASAKIDASSINTANEKRDEHLRSPEFFDVKKFPEMTFVSREARPTGKDTLQLVGDLTMRGVTKSVTLDATFNGAIKDPWGTERAGFSATGKVNRKDFGIIFDKRLDSGGLVLGEEVQILLEIEGVKKK